MWLYQRALPRRRHGASANVKCNYLQCQRVTLLGHCGHSVNSQSGNHFIGRSTWLFCGVVDIHVLIFWEFEYTGALQTVNLTVIATCIEQCNVTVFSPHGNIQHLRTETMFKRRHTWLLIFISITCPSAHCAHERRPVSSSPPITVPQGSGISFIADTSLYVY